MSQPQEIADLVDLDHGMIARKIFVDEDIYRLEMEHIFGHSWLFLGHESQILQAGDFFTTYMGEDEVIVVRGEEGKIRAFLNSCAHRGAKVCRADRGTTKAFHCPYHGWTYDTKGRLVGVPRRKILYEQLAAESTHLREVGRVDSIYGLIFGNWDVDGPSLKDYLGDMLFYLDLMFNRMEGGVEVVGGVHRWTIDVNWKIPSENFGGDYYHLPMTHAAGIDLGFRNPVTNNGYSIAAGNGHSFGAELGGAQQGKTVQSEYTRFVEKMREQVAATRGAQYNQFIPIGVGNIFPNLSFMDTMRFRSLRLWQPKGPSRIEVQSWCLVDRALSPELKEAARQQYTLAFGPSGMFEQDDGDVWTSIQETLKGARGREGWFNYQMGLGREFPVSEKFGKEFPGTMGDTLMTEANHRAFYRNWLKLMHADQGECEEEAAPSVSPKEVVQ